MPSVILHLHIPKTGGTSLKALFEANIDAGQIIDLSQGLHGIVSAFHRIKANHQDVAMVTTAANFGIHEFIPFGPRTYSYCTMVRHPVSYLKSLYYHCRRTPTNAFHRLANDLDLRSWFLASHRPTNGQTYMLSGYGETKGLAAARRNLLERIEVFGLTERFADSVALICRHYGFHNDAVPHLNIGDGGKAETISDEELLTLCGRSDAQDIELGSIRVRSAWQPVIEFVAL